MTAMSSDLGTRLTGSLANAPGALSYPISGYTYFVIRKKNMSNCTLAVEMLRMFKYVMEDPLAQTIVTDLFKAPLSNSVLQQVKKHVFDEMECQGSKVAQLLEIIVAVEDGSYDSWKLPVTVVVALLGAVIMMMLGFLGFVKYFDNRTVLRNSFIITLFGADQSVSRSMASIKALSLTSNEYLRADTTNWGVRLDPDESIVKQASGDFLVRNLCPHFRLDVITWPTRVLLVRMKDKIMHTNVIKFVGITFHAEVWKLVTETPSKGN
jgi:hypothetical protein